MPWEKQYDHEQVVDRAMRHFWAHGYASSSINKLVAATGINRGSLYAGFRGKRALFIESLRRYDQRQRALFLAGLSRENGPREAIIAAFTSAAHGSEEHPGGCLLVNTAMEMAPHDPELQTFVNDAFNAVREFFRDRITQAQADGAINATLASTELAETLLGLFLGLRVLHRSGAPLASRQAIVTRADALLDG